MCKVRLLRTLVKQRLNVAVEEIFELFERTIAELEKELYRGIEENERRQRELVDTVLKPHVTTTCGADVQQVLVESEKEEKIPSEQQVSVEFSHVKEEEKEVQDGDQLQGLEDQSDVNSLSWTDFQVKSEDEEGVSSLFLHTQNDYPRQVPNPSNVKAEHIWSSQDGEQLQGLEEADVITFTLTGVHVKSEKGEGRSSRNERFRQHMTTEADGVHFHSQPSNFAPLSHMNMMPTDTDHNDGTREPLGTNQQSKGMTSKAAETARRYRERRDADPDRRRKYLEKEREKWKKLRETRKKKSVHELSEMEKWAVRKKWREAKSQARARNRAIGALLQWEMPLNSPVAENNPEQGPFRFDHRKLR